MEILKRTRSDVKHITHRRSSLKRRRSSSDGRCYENAVVFDNGAYTMKIGYGKDEEPSVMLNAIMKAKSERKRAFIGDQIDDCRDLSGLYYILPHENGYVSNFEVQKNIWDYALSKYSLEDNTVLLTQPIFNFRNIEEFVDEVFFEEFGVKAIFKANATDYAFYNYIKEFQLPNDASAIVIDTGYSFTHIVPYIKGEKYAQGIIRVNLGGKILTNYLKELISYRQLNVMEETYVINQVKEDACFMASNFTEEMDHARHTHDLKTNYILPDFYSLRRGYLQHPSDTTVVENCQVLRLNNERITIPEIMLNPSIIPGLDCAGITECLAESIKRCPKEYCAEICRNAVLCGGTSMFRGFRKRLERDTRSFLPHEYEFKLYQHKEADNYAWHGGKAMAMNAELKNLCVTKQNYEDYGSDYVHSKFTRCYKLEKRKNNDVDDKEPFSYLNYWKNEGVDLFGKEPPQPLKEPNVQFTLEGDDIEKYDGKYVTIEFECNETEENTPPVEEKVERISAPETTRLRLRKSTNLTPIPQPTPAGSSLLNRVTPAARTPAITRPMSTVNINTRGSLQSSTKRCQTFEPSAGPSTRFLTLPKTHTPNILRKPAIVKSSNAIPKVSLASIVSQAKQLAQNQPKIINSNITLPKLTQFQVVKSISQNSSTGQPKIAQLKSLNLSDAFVIPTVGSHNKALTTNKILNNAVIVPQHTASNKNLTFQIIPISSEGKSSKITIIKKP